MFRYLLPLLLALAPLGVTANDLDEWPTTKFEVFVGNPFSGHRMYEEDGRYDSLEFENQLNRVDERAVRHMERMLHEAAEWYKKKGFPPPLLEPIVETNAGRAYRVYLCRYETDQRLWDGFTRFVGVHGESLIPQDQLEWRDCHKPALYTEPCTEPARKNYLYFNIDKVIANNKLTELGHATLAHELMHAIFYNTDSARSRRDQGCTVNKWISEGINDAIGWDMAEEKWANKEYRDEQGTLQTHYVPETSDSQINKRWGYRPYYLPLTDSESITLPFITGELLVGYHTSSFWRFVADQDASKWRKLVKPEPPARARGLLHTWFPGVQNPDWRSEVQWVDTWLRGRFKMGLDAMYAHFVSVFSLSVPDPTYRIFREDLGYNPDTDQNVPDEVVDQWLKMLFEECYKVDLSSGTLDAIEVSIDRLAARCLWVEPIDVNSKFEVTFHAGNDDASLLDDIWISKAGTTLQVNTSVAGSAEEVSGSTGGIPPVLQWFRYYSSWTGFSADGANRTLFLISNVASKPENTKPREFILLAARPDGTNTFVGPLPPSEYVPPPDKPSSRKHSKTLNKRKGETGKMLLEQMEKDKFSQTFDTTHGSRIRRDPKRVVCPNPFVYTACGPQMHITLTLVPGTYMLPGFASTTGGMTAQFMGAGLLAGQMRLKDTPEEEQEVLGRIDSIDGHTVYISTPYFDYGFSGTFDSAEIRVKMGDGKTLSAFGPPDHRGKMPLTGQVTIDEYTPFILRGSYVAPLAEMVRVPGGNPVREPRDTISGTFTTVAPWLADERIKRKEESEEVKMDEFMNTIGLPPGFLSRTRQEGGTPGGSMEPGAGPGGDGGASEADGCRCECDYREFADELCEWFCKDEFAACD